MGKRIIIHGADFSANAVDTVTRHSISYSLSHVTASAAPSAINDGATLEITFTPDEGYALPQNVSVKNTATNADILSAFFNRTTGKLTVTNVSVNITITVIGEASSPDAPSLTATPSSLTLTAKAGSSATETITLGGANLTGNVTLSVSSGSGITLSQNSFTAEQVMNGATVTLTFSPSSEASAESKQAVFEASTSVGQQSIQRQVSITTVTKNADLEYLYEFPDDISKMIDNCGIDATDGELKEGFSLWAATDYLPIDGYTKYVLVHSHTPANNFGLAWYNSQQQYISGIQFKSNNDGATQNGSLPSNAKYVRFCLLKNTNEGYAAVSLTLKDE